MVINILVIIFLKFYVGNQLNYYRNGHAFCKYKLIIDDFANKFDISFRINIFVNFSLQNIKNLYFTFA